MTDPSLRAEHSVVKTAAGPESAGARSAGAAIAGAGLMGYWHAQAIERCGGRVLAVVDRDLPAAQRLAARFPGAQAYTSLDAAAAEQPLHVLHVCTPTSTHVALAAGGLQHGLHVLVEKPLAPAAVQVGTLLDLAEQHDLLLCPVHQFVFQDGVQAAQRRLPSLGKLVRLRVEIRSAGGVGSDDAAQDQLVADILPHCLSLAQFLLPDALPHVRWTTLRPRTGELLVIGQAGGTAVEFDLSLHGRPPVNYCTLVGERGSLHMNLFHGYAVHEPGTVSRRQKVAQPFSAAATELAAAAVNLGRRSVRRQGAYPGLWELVSRFYAALAQHTPAPILPAAVLAVACARDAILEELAL